ncbi:DoxX family protein [Frigidibacter sp. MR17.14]|uniref:DoxX family protein n=1 Tax=Frigidibacter sp. MR17.14 TaxID=3126509 RepID=UPI003012FBEE
MRTALSRPIDPATAEPLALRLALLGLCAAYVQGPITKLADFGGAIAEMRHFGLHPAAPMAVGVILFELVASAMIVCGVGRRAAAAALALFTCAATLLALRFWELPAGTPARIMAMNGFFEHIGLAAAFAMIAMGRLAR